MFTYCRCLKFFTSLVFASTVARFAFNTLISYGWPIYQQRQSVGYPERVFSHHSSIGRMFGMNNKRKEGSNMEAEDPTARALVQAGCSFAKASQQVLNPEPFCWLEDAQGSIRHNLLGDQLDILVGRRVWLVPKIPLPFIACSELGFTLHWHQNIPKPVEAPTIADGASASPRQQVLKVEVFPESAGTLSLLRSVEGHITTKVELLSAARIGLTFPLETKNCGFGNWDLLVDCRVRDSSIYRQIIPVQVVDGFSTPIPTNRRYAGPLSFHVKSGNAIPRSAPLEWMRTPAPVQPEPTPLRLLCTRLDKDVHIPVKMSPGAVGFDVFANEDASIDPSGKPVLVPTGLCVQPEGPFFVKVESRSSLAKEGIISVGGIIDPDYTGEVKVMLSNLSDSPYSIKKGDRIAQFVCIQHSTLSPIPVTRSIATERGPGAFGSTGR